MCFDFEISIQLFVVHLVHLHIYNNRKLLYDRDMPKKGAIR